MKYSDKQIIDAVDRAIADLKKRGVGPFKKAGSPTDKTGEIPLSDIDFENDSYYEVELWEGGDCDGRFFRYKRDAVRFLNANGKTPYDCVKFHEAECLGGNCRIVCEYHRPPNKEERQ